MRNKIDYGIDLGTTNSAIARMENGVPVIKRSGTLKDTFPSCIHFNKKQGVIVGDPAYNIMKNDNARALKTFEKGSANTFIEFKRTMGTTLEYESSNMDRSFTSDELSAEVLKTLKSVIDENISSIVITVPAKFLNPQNEATINAAKLLGFKQIELLQEPVAAATAYGLNSKNKDGFWLVFDFGGGTFDAALIKAEEGILSVKDTDGDNWLGGKNLDEAIVDQIIIPNLQQNFAIESVLADSNKKEILRNAVKFYAEEAKIELSFKDSYNLLSALGDLPFEDDNGDEPEIDVLVTQKDMEDVLGPIFQKAIDITKELLKRNNLKGSDLSALILVGGPTYSPVLRTMLKEQITENVDTSADPMTVVAKGAALFASTISVSDEVKEVTRDKTKLQFDLKYEASTVHLSEMISLKVLKENTTGIFPEKIYVDIVRTGGIAWSSGNKQIGEKATLVDVELNESCSNPFEILVYDEQGNKLECQPNQFSILQGIGGLDEMQVLPYHIGIGKFFHNEGKDLYAGVKGLEKSKKLPAVGIANGLKTRSAIRPGMKNDIIRIPIYQGDYDANGSNPALNNLVYEVIITGESLPALLPENSDVDITIKIDRSQTMKFSAYFPLLDYTEELEIEIHKTQAPEKERLSKEIAIAKKNAKIANATIVTKNIEELEAQLENEGESADGKMKIQDALRKELLKLDEAEKTAEWPKVEQELKDTFFDFEDLISKLRASGEAEELNIDKIESHMKEYKEKIEHIIKNKETKEAKELTSEIGIFNIEIRNEASNGAVDISRVKYHDKEFNNIQWKDKNKARLLVNQGLQLIVDGKTKSLRPLLFQIWDLRIDQKETNDDGTTLG